MNVLFEKKVSFWTLVWGSQTFCSLYVGHIALAIYCVIMWVIFPHFVFNRWPNSVFLWVNTKQFSIYDAICIAVLVLTLAYIGWVTFTLLAAMWILSAYVIDRK